MTLCNLCAKSYFDFDKWYRDEAKGYQTCVNERADAINHCSICLTMAEAVRQAIFGNDESPLCLSDIVQKLHPPVYQVYLHESAARDQWELDFKPLESTISWEDRTVELPVRTFKVFAAYYNSVRLKPAKIDVAQKFREHVERQRRSGVTEKQITPDVEVTTRVVRQLSIKQKADGSTTNVSSPHQDQCTPKTTNSRNAFSQFRQWLKNCEKHEQCKHLSQPNRSDFFVPTRLLQVGQGHSISRIETRGEEKYWRYATLSHCWGWGDNKPPEFHNDDNENARHTIEVNDLPANFREAVEAARILGIEYLWIDSLCIIQDSPADKAIEIPNMEKIYGRSFLNIAAANSHHSRGGLFRDRNLSLLSSTVQIGDVPCKIIRKDFWDGELLSQPLYKRAWVLQERALSPRTIHFANQVFWQCLGTTACELMPDGIPLVIDSGREELKWRRLLHQKEHSTQDRINLQGTWQHLVKAYKGCGITKESDVLCAVNGLVTRVSEISKEISYAGLWEGELVEQLAWRVVRPGVRYPTYCAPTWSWASVDALVELPPRVIRQTDYKLKYVDCEIEEVLPAQIKSACLYVEGCVFENERRIGMYHPDLLDLLDSPKPSTAAKRLVLPLYYKSINAFVSGWGLAVAVKGEGYERIGLVEWRNIPNDTWAEEMLKYGEDRIVELR